VKTCTCGLNVLLICISLSLCELYFKFCVLFGLEHAPQVTVLRRYSSSSVYRIFEEKDERMSNRIRSNRQGVSNRR
jgi:hypothetical protein